ncbi:unnamed protein product [Clavelina lepadiformis]|uniref:Expansin-like CBD domain-containing protein n=1 Tax=Clavelina lepadiformis TaxID=159417 RepID=A0ABP0G2P9_CLALP
MKICGLCEQPLKGILHRFSVQVKTVSPDGFKVNIQRTDNSTGWGQNPTLYWVADGRKLQGKLPA